MRKNEESFNNTQVDLLQEFDNLKYLKNDQNKIMRDEDTLLQDIVNKADAFSNIHLEAIQYKINILNLE